MAVFEKTRNGQKKCPNPYGQKILFLWFSRYIYMHSNIIKYHKVSFTPEDLTVLPQMQFPQVQVRNTCATELRIDDAVPFTTTPNHRIMVPCDGDEKTVKAVDLKLGSWVLCSDRVAKKVIGKREYLAVRLPKCST